MKRFFSILTLLLTGLTAGLGLGGAALWWTAKQQDTPFPPLWAAELVEPLRPGNETSPGGAPDPGGTATAEPPPAPGTRQLGGGKRNVPTRAGQSAYRKKWAIVIGINAYTKVNPLTYAHNDAREFREILIEDFGYAPEQMRYLAAIDGNGEEEGVNPEVAPGAEGIPTLESLRETFATWLPAQDIQEDDALVIFYAGHGFVDRKEEGWLAPVHAEATDERFESTCLPVKELKDALDALPCRHKLVILDCCYSGSLFKGRSDFQEAPVQPTPGVLLASNQTAPAGPAGDGPNTITRGHGSSSALKAEDNLAVYFGQPAAYGISAGRDTPVVDGTAADAHSLFTKTLLAVMRERANSGREDHAFTFRQLAAQVEGRVAFSAGSIQVPDSGRLGPGDGDFVFQVEEQPDPNATPRERERSKEGKEYLLMAEQAKGIPETQLLAARSIGYQEGYGRPGKAAILRLPTESEARRFWERTLPLLDPRRDREDYQKALNLIKGSPPRFRPTLYWSSPTRNHHSASVRSVAWSPDGSRLASAGADNTIRLWEAATGQPLGQPLTGHTGGVMSVAWSPDGSRLASAGGDDTIRLWEAATGEPVGQPLTGHTGWVNSVAWSPDGSRLASASGDRTIRLWEAATGEPLGQPLDGGWVTSVAWSPDGTRLASASPDEMIFRLWEAATGQPLGQPLTGHTGGVASVAWSPDGSRLASASSDKTIRLWEAATGEPLGQPLTGHTDEIRSVAWSPDGTRLASASRDETIRLWEAATGQPLGQPLTGHTGGVWSVAWSPDGSRLASASGDRTIRLWEAATGEPLGQPLTGHTGGVWSVAWSPDGSRLASASGDKTIRLWEAATGEPLGQPLSGHTGWVMSVAWSPDGSRLASAAADNTIRLWEAATGEPLGQPLTRHTDGVNSVAWSPDGSRLASASTDKTIRLWEAATGEPLGQPLTGHTDGVASVAWSPDGSRLASASRDMTIRLWEAATGEPLGQPLTGHTGGVWSVAWSPDGSRLASAAGDGTIRLWEAATGEPLGQPLTGHGAWVYSVAWSPEGTRLASALADGTIRLWDAATGTQLGVDFAGHEGMVASVAWSPDGSRLASASWDKTIRLWEAATGEPLGQPLTRHTGGVNSVAWSPDGSRLASASRDMTIRLWEAATGEPLGQPLTGHTDGVNSVAWSPDGSHLASGSYDGTIRLWDPTTGQPFGEPFVGHEEPVWSVAWSPDGTRLASASFDETIRLWEAATGEPLGQPLTGHTGWVMSVAWSPDGSRLASASRDKTIRLWEAATGEPLGQPLTGHSDAVMSVAWSPDGSRLASAADDEAIRLWEAATGEPVGQPLTGYTEGVASVVWSPDGFRLASASWDGTIRLWEAATGEPVGQPRTGHSDGVNSVAWSPDGSRLASASRDNTIRLWEPDFTSPALGFRPDLSLYFRQQWAQVDRAGRSIDWFVPASLFDERPFQMINLRPGSMGSRLHEAGAEPARINAILLADAIKRRFWKAAWACYEGAAEEPKTKFAPDLFRGLYLAAATPNPRYPSSWLPERLQTLQADHGEVCERQLEAMWPMAWKGFATGILGYRENSKDQVLETLALDALDRNREATGEDLSMTRALVLHRLGRPIREPLAVGAEPFREALERSGELGRKEEFAWLLDGLGSTFAISGLDPSDAELRTMAGWFWLGFGENDRALEAFEGLTKAPGLAGLAAAQWATGDPDAATQTYTQLLSLNDEGFTSDATPEPPHAVRDHLDRPVPVPALLAVHEAVAGGAASPESVEPSPQ